MFGAILLLVLLSSAAPKPAYPGSQRHAHGLAGHSLTGRSLTGHSLTGHSLAGRSLAGPAGWDWYQDDDAAQGPGADGGGSDGPPDDDSSERSWEVIPTGEHSNFFEVAHHENFE